MLEFGMLAVLLWYALKQHVDSYRVALPLAAVITLLYALSDEYHQSFVQGRQGTLRDVGFDLAGIVFAAVILLLIGRRRQA